MKLLSVILLGLFAGLTGVANAQATGGQTPSPPGAAVYFVDLKDGATIGPKTTVHFGLHGMGVAPAGVEKANSGHHHLLIDTPLPPFDEPIPSDDNHLHFGAGQTETMVTLPQGRHTLQLLLGDSNHVPHDPPVFSKPITVYVGIAAPLAPAPSTSQRKAPLKARNLVRTPGVSSRAATPSAPDSSNGRCQTGFHDVPSPNGSGFRCVPNGA